MKIQISLSATPVLYHITTIRAAASIAQKDRFELKPSDGTDTEEALQGKASYYLSTARHKTASYTKQKLSSSSAIFVLDGIALSSKYKIKAVDYWAGMYRDGEEMHNRERMESEDRVMSNSPFIKDVYKYVSEIHAFADGTAKDSAQHALALYRYGKKHKIPVYFYAYGDGNKADVDQMLLLDKRKAIPFDPIAAMKKKDNTPPRKMGDYDFKYRRNNNEIVGWLQLYEIPVKGDWRERQKLLVGDRVKGAYDNLRYFHNGDPLRQFNNALHNEKSTPYGYTSRGREDLDRAIKLLRKLKLTPKQFVELLYKKWFSEE